MILGTLTLTVVIVKQPREIFQKSDLEQILVYQVSNRLAIDHLTPNEARLFVNEAEPIDLLSYQIDPHRLALNYRPISETFVEFDSAANFNKVEALTMGVLGNLRILVFDTTTFQLDFPEKIHTDILIIDNEAVKSLKWLSKHFDFKHLILGNRNRRTYVRRLQEQAAEEDILIHSLLDDGAFVLDVRK